MAKKYYAVLDNNLSYILDNWEDTQILVKGISNIKYKSFTNYNEAVQYLEDFGVKEEDILLKCDKNTSKNEKSRKSVNGPTTFINLSYNEMYNELVCYVDGSYDAKNKVYSYGLVVMINEQVLGEFSGKGSRSEYASMHNVAGEILGAVKAVEFAIKNGYKIVHLFYDYQGIESWATGTWKRNNDLTKGYNEFIKANKDKVTIKFHKVKGHSNDKWNDRADELARGAIGK